MDTLTDGRYQMDKGRETMIRQARIEYVIGLITLIWSTLSVLFSSQPMIHELTSVMPAISWTFSGFVIGGAQIIISRNPDRCINTLPHWIISFLSAIFWVYMGMAASRVDVGALPVLIYWATALATLWELGHVRT